MGKKCSKKVILLEAKKQVSLANKLTFDFRSVAKSFMYIRKKRGPKIDPCGTSARIHSQSDVFPLRVTL